MYGYICPAQKHMQESVAIKATAPPCNPAQMCLSFHGALKGPLRAEAGWDGKHCSNLLSPVKRDPQQTAHRGAEQRRLVGRIDFGTGDQSLSQLMLARAVIAVPSEVVGVRQEPGQLWASLRDRH